MRPNDMFLDEDYRNLMEMCISYNDIFGSDTYIQESNMYDNVVKTCNDFMSSREELFEEDCEEDYDL